MLRVILSARPARGFASRLSQRPSRTSQEIASENRAHLITLRITCGLFIVPFMQGVILRTYYLSTPV